MYLYIKSNYQQKWSYTKCKLLPFMYLLFLTHSFIVQLLEMYYMLDTVIGGENTATNKDRVITFLDLTEKVNK